MKLFLVFLSFLFITHPLFSQCEDFVPYDTVYIGPTRNITHPIDFFKEDRFNTMVYIDSGVYYIGEYDFWMNGSHIKVEGIGRVSIYATRFYSNVLWIEGSHIHIKHLHMKHFKPGGEEYQNCSGRVIGFDHAKNITIEDCDLNGCGLAGLHDNLGNENIFVKDNYIHNNSLGAYTDIDGGVWQVAIDSHAVFRFQNNRIENNGPDRIYEADTLTIDLLDSMERVGLDSVILQWSHNGFGTCVPMYLESNECTYCYMNDYELIIRTDGFGKTQVDSVLNDAVSCDDTADGYSEFKDCLIEMIEYDWVFDDHLRFKTIRIKLGDWLRCRD